MPLQLLLWDAFKSASPRPCARRGMAGLCPEGKDERWMSAVTPPARRQGQKACVLAILWTNWSQKAGGQMQLGEDRVPLRAPLRWEMSLRGSSSPATLTLLQEEPWAVGPGMAFAFGAGRLGAAAVPRWLHGLGKLPASLSLYNSKEGGFSEGCWKIQSKREL